MSVTILYHLCALSLNPEEHCKLSTYSNVDFRLVKSLGPGTGWKCNWTCKTVLTYKVIYEYILKC